MALGKALGIRTVPGASTRQLLTLTGDASSYVTGGFVITPADFQLTVIREIISATFTSIAGAAFEVATVPTLNADGITIASIAVALVVGTTGLQLANGGSSAGVVIQIVVEGN
jgi:hypothetical protein